jgi:hypothetical protein
MQDNARDVTPIGTISVGIKEAHVRDQVFVVIRRKDRVGRRDIGNVWIERRLLHAGTGVLMSDTKAKPPVFYISSPDHWLLFQAGC